MVDSKPRNTTLKKLARWTPSSPSTSNDRRTASIPPLSSDAPFVHVHHDKLQQGSLYIIKIKQVSLAMFEGWNDDMCCFSVLRSEVEPLRWSEARQLPGDFDIYDAFDESGNPPIHLWTRYLKVSVPMNWFSMFEEAKRKQRDWTLRQQQFRQSLIIQQQQNDYYYSSPTTPPPIEEDNSMVGINNPTAVYSNTDVSTMSLNPHESMISPVASIDPSPTTPSLTTTANSNSHNNRQVSPSPSHIIEQPLVDRSSSGIMNREQIRRHLAPGQAIITNRSSSVTLSDSGVTLPKDSSLIESKELGGGRIITEGDNNKLVESNISSIYSNDLEFLHDSDKFSIRSDIVGSKVAPSSLKPSLSSKSRNRPSMKKIIWG